jgi:hypothetical protein
MSVRDPDLESLASGPEFRQLVAGASDGDALRTNVA